MLKTIFWHVTKIIREALKYPQNIIFSLVINIDIEWSMYDLFLKLESRHL